MSIDEKAFDVALAANTNQHFGNPPSFEDALRWRLGLYEAAKSSPCARPQSDKSEDNQQPVGIPYTTEQERERVDYWKGKAFEYMEELSKIQAKIDQDSILHMHSKLKREAVTLTEEEMTEAIKAMIDAAQIRGYDGKGMANAPHCPARTLRATEAGASGQGGYVTARTKEEAFANGEMHYFNGTPCKHGHIALRKRSTGNCVECYKTVYVETQKEHRKKNAKRISRVKKDYERRGTGRAKHLARIRVKNALKFGRLMKQPCQRCGEIANVHAHHDDYSKPLDVMWLCPLHHRQRHKELEEVSLIEVEAGK